MTSKNSRLSPANGPAVEELTKLVLNGTLGACRSFQRKGVCWWRSAHGIFTPNEPAAAGLEATDFLSADQRASMIVLTPNAEPADTGSPYELEVWSHLHRVIDGWLANHADAYDVGVTHEHMLLNDAQSGAVKDFETGDMVTLPIAWLLLAMSCGPPAVLGLVTLASTLLSTFYILQRIASGNWFCRDGGCPGPPAVQFPGFFPAILVNTVIAVSLDYTLFILTRFREELRVAHTNLDAVAATMSSAGRVVLVSGITLTATFAGLTTCVEPVVNSIGWGGAIAICVAMLVHLTLLPALLYLTAELCMPCFRRCHRFRRLRWPSCLSTSQASQLGQPLAMTDSLSTGRPGTHTAADPPTADLAAAALAAAGLPSEASPQLAADSAVQTSARPHRPHRPRSRWVRLALLCRNHRIKVLLVNAALLAPWALLCCWVHVSTTQAMLTPRDSPALRTLDMMPSLGLSPGALNPLRVITYNLDVSSPRLGCTDDDADVRQVIEGMQLPEFSDVPLEVRHPPRLPHVRWFIPVTRLPRLLSISLSRLTLPPHAAGAHVPQPAAAPPDL